MNDNIIHKYFSNSFVWGSIALLAAIPIAIIIHIVVNLFPDNPEKSIVGLGIFFCVLLFLPIISYIFLNFKKVDPSKVGLLFLTVILILLVAIYFYWLSFYLFFPADIFIWAESDFINDIIKIRTGYPFYTSFLNNESQVYPPGAQILTYSLAWIFGKAQSIPFYRIVQLGFNITTAFIASNCCKLLIDLNFPQHDSPKSPLWSAIGIPFFFLIATNSITNPFVHNIHNDSLLQLGIITAYWLLLKYSMKPTKLLFVFLAILPGLGFLIKQNYLIWIPLYLFQLLISTRPRSLKNIILFIGIALVIVLVVIGSCYLLWREHFIFWVFSVLKNSHISILRSIQHIMETWPYWAIGLLGGLYLIHRNSNKKLLYAWLVWILLFLAGAYTSGVAWTKSHMGPGSVIAAIWFFTAIKGFWNTSPIFTANGQLQKWLSTGIMTALFCLLFNGLGVIRIPGKPFSDDAYRYVKEIENEFTGKKSENILLDVGSWIYLKKDIVMKDRATAIADRGLEGMGGFSGIIRRISEKKYHKILVRNYHSGNFWYDHSMWSVSSGIKKALQDNYFERKVIKAVKKNKLQPELPYLFNDISVLVPKTD